MHSKDVREKIINYRKMGLSYNDICLKTNVSKSSVRNIVKDIPLTIAQKEILLVKQIQKAKDNLVKSHNLRRKNTLRIRRVHRKIATHNLNNINDPLYFLGLGLYWGEGLKKGNQEVGIVNSDPKIISTVLLWMKTYFGIQEDRLICRLTLNQSQVLHEKEHLLFWQNELKLTADQFTKTSFSTSTTVYSLEYNPNYHGVLRVKVRKPLGLREIILESIKSI